MHVEERSPPKQQQPAPRAGEEKICVSVRCRPLSTQEISNRDVSTWKVTDGRTLAFTGHLPERSPYPGKYNFDHVFGPECPSQKVYNDAARDVVLSSLSGINATIFAYGQTSSGKTYTMKAIMDSAALDIFNHIEKHSLGGNARTAIICTMSPALSHVDQTRNTLSFASRAKEVTNSAHVNVMVSDKVVIKQLQREIAKLQNELKSLPEETKAKELQLQEMEMEMRELAAQRDAAHAQVMELTKIILRCDSKNLMAQREYNIRVSALEIYNEVVRDLLNAESGALKLLDDPDRGTVVGKLTEEVVTSSAHLRMILAECASQRQVGETHLNDASSRSHQIIRLMVESSPKGRPGQAKLSDDVDLHGQVWMSSLNFVDLAGSERASQTMAEGTRLKEGCHINRSLLTLGTVIRKLRSASRKQRKGGVVVSTAGHLVGQDENRPPRAGPSPQATPTTEPFGSEARESRRRGRRTESRNSLALVQEIKKLEHMEDELGEDASRAMEALQKEIECLRLAQVSSGQDVAAIAKLQVEIQSIQGLRSGKGGILMEGEGARRSLKDTTTPLWCCPGRESKDQKTHDAVASLEEKLDCVQHSLEKMCPPCQPQEENKMRSSVRKTRSSGARSSATLLRQSSGIESGQHGGTMHVRRPSTPTRSFSQQMAGKTRNSGGLLCEKDENVPLEEQLPPSGQSLQSSDGVHAVSAAKDPTKRASVDIRRMQTLFKTAAEENIKSIRNYVTDLKERVAKLHYQKQLLVCKVLELEADARRSASISFEDDEEGESPMPSWPARYEQQRQEIIELWDTCHVSLLHRTHFLLTLTGDPIDAMYLEVEKRRLLWLRDQFMACTEEGKEEPTALQGAVLVMKREREMFARRMKQRFTPEERLDLYEKWGVPIDSKQRKLQLTTKLWSDAHDLKHVMASAEFIEQLMALKENVGSFSREMFQLQLVPRPTYPPWLTRIQWAIEHIADQINLVMAREAEKRGRVAMRARVKRMVMTRMKGRERAMVMAMQDNQQKGNGEVDGDDQDEGWAEGDGDGDAGQPPEGQGMKGRERVMVMALQDNHQKGKGEADGDYQDEEGEGGNECKGEADEDGEGGNECKGEGKGGREEGEGGNECNGEGDEDGEGGNDCKGEGKGGREEGEGGNECKGEADGVDQDEG
ncbi:hypothetical protein CBR_g38162 [Chara braunii]|uniref:Kinesin motor domain-containing protein n=1 Tax=Chara braunii TaxID=69332 RepID=A0A388LPI8_CHABU|nr:hypothetical protein CBR_g38162 [Chara braunii]|eukprot:GBG84191.1 hypothetical protein CBR_g38162 [Chara braunii]